MGDCRHLELAETVRAACVLPPGWKFSSTSGPTWFDILGRPSSGVDAWLRLEGQGVDYDDIDATWVTVSAYNAGLNVDTGTLFGGIADAFRRCMGAAGLLPLWSEMVPTEEGAYLVVEPGADVELWMLDDDPTGEARPWVSPWSERFGVGSWEPGTLFMRCPAPPAKETP